MRKQQIFMMMLILPTYVISSTRVMTSSTTTSPPACSTNTCRCQKELKRVYCNERSLGGVPDGLPNATRLLQLRGNQIKAIEVDQLSHLRRLEELDLFNNTLKALPRDLPTSLTKISLRSNEVGYVGAVTLHTLTSLEDLNLSDNLLHNGVFRPGCTEAMRSGTQLRVVDVSRNKFTLIPLRMPSSVKFLNMERNLIRKITRMATSSLDGVEHLNLGWNRLTIQGVESGSLQLLKSLQTLDLGHNKLTEIPRGLPASLVKLHLGGNRITYIRSEDVGAAGSFRKLVDLQNLDLSGNRIKSFQKNSFESLKQLGALALHSNPIVCDCYVRGLRQWISSSDVVVSNRDNIRCAGSDRKLLEIQPDQLKCPLLSSDQLRTADDRASPGDVTVIVNRTASFPPFAQFSVLYGNARQMKSPSRMFMEAVENVILLKPGELQFSIPHLVAGNTYKVCVYPTAAQIRHGDLFNVTPASCFDVTRRSAPLVAGPRRESTAGVSPIGNRKPEVWVVLTSSLVILFLCSFAFIACKWVRATYVHRKSVTSSMSSSSTSNDIRHHIDRMLHGGGGGSGSEEQLRRYASESSLDQLRRSTLVTSPSASPPMNALVGNTLDARSEFIIKVNRRQSHTSRRHHHSNNGRLLRHNHHNFLSQPRNHHQQYYHQPLGGALCSLKHPHDPQGVTSRDSWQSSDTGIYV